METKQETSTTAAHDEVARLLTVAADIVREDHARVARIAQAGIPNRADIDLSFELSDIKTDLCETFRQRFHPTALRVVAVFGQVFTLSPEGDARLVFQVTR